MSRIPKTGSMGYVKYWLGGKKLYASIVATVLKPRYLHRRHRRASEAEQYGKAVMKRYLLALAAQAARIAEAEQALQDEQPGPCQGAQEPAIAAIVDQDKSQP